MLDEEYTCTLCGSALVAEDQDAEPERIVALACTQPPSHFFHGSCLDEWRQDSDIGATCPTCTLNPVAVLRRTVTTAVLKKRIKKKRESCWRVFWAEWARQRSLVAMIMLAVGMCLIIFNVMEEWIRGWTHRTEL